MPEDWRLEVAIKDKGLMAYTDALIGSTVIDLENRLFSSPLVKCNRALLIELKKQKEMKKKVSKAKGAEKKALKAEQQGHMARIKGHFQRIKRIEQVLIPIEYRELRHPQKSQG